MTIHVLAMFAGVFVVPALLLWTAHRFRRRSAHTQALFRGALAGHLLSLVVGMWAALSPAEAWGPDDVVRGALGLWSFLLLPCVGAVISAVMSERNRQAVQGKVGEKVG